MSKQSGSLSVTAAFGTKLVTGEVSTEAAGLNFQELTVAHGTGGFLTTRTDDNTGVATLASGHGLLTGDIVDVYWEFGCRYGMDATVNGDAVTIDGGDGDSLPGQSTTVALCKRTVLAVPVTGDDLVQVALLCDQRCQVVFRDSEQSVLWDITLVADAPWTWIDGLYVDNPMSSYDVADICISNGSPEVDAEFQCGIFYNSDSVGS